MNDLRVQTLTAAFYNDPFAEFLFPIRKSRAKRLSLAMEFVLGLSVHQFHISSEKGECTGVIGALPPGSYPIPFSFMLPFLIKLIFKSLWSGVPLSVVYKCLKIFKQIDKYHIREPHWHVQVVGVHPNHQGKGLGGKLLGPVLQKADDEGIAVYLESSNPRNLDFYRRHGFEVLEEITLTDGCPIIRRMLRKPTAQN